MKCFVDNSNNCCKLAVATLNESYRWLAQSFEESKSFTCSFKELVNGCELSYLNNLVKAFIEVNGSSIKITFRGFVFVPEHTSGSEMSMFNVVYELSEESEKLYFDNPLREPCETSGGEAINAFLETSSQVGGLGGLNP
jgi:hypothetical protein